MDAQRRDPLRLQSTGTANGAPVNIDNRIKYRHLLCFLEISRQGSLARAAETLAVSQPAISKTLKELEALLGTSLFERSKTGVRLTAAGSAFLRYAGPSVQALREGVRSLRAGEHEAGMVRLGVLSTVESALLPDVVRRLHAQHAALVVKRCHGAGRIPAGPAAQRRTGPGDRPGHRQSADRGAQFRAPL